MKPLVTLFLSVFILLASSQDALAKTELWIYTSLYKDTIADIQPQLEKQFQDIKFNFYQAGSEEVAAKYAAEELAGGTKADVMISSDRFWYEDLAQQKKLHAYKSPATKEIPADLKNSQGFYSTLSIPVMVLAYNNEAVADADAPKSFKDLTASKWKGKFSSGSPLTSGTNFTTVAFLQKKYGWEFFKSLKANETISEGSNGSVIKRLQSKERPIGWVLMENVLRFQDTDKRIKFVVPQDGAIIQNNVIAITTRSANKAAAEKFVDWMYSEPGQLAMTKSYMYSPLAKIAAPKGAPELKTVLATAKKWSPELIKEFMESREKIKDQFSQIMFQ